MSNPTGRVKSSKFVKSGFGGYTVVEKEAIKSPFQKPKLGSNASAGLGENQEQIGEIVTGLGQSSDQIQADYRSNQEQIIADKEDFVSKSDALYDEVLNGYEDNMIDSESMLSGMRKTLETEVSRMADSYNNQMARESERVDALVAGGVMGGNAYRAYQAHTQSTRDLLAQSSGQIAALNLQMSESMADKGIAINKYNQDLYTQTMGTLAGIIGSRAQAMVGFSSLLVESTNSASQSLQGLMGLSLSALQAGDDFALAAKGLDVQTFGIEMDSYNKMAGIVLSDIASSGWSTATELEVMEDMFGGGGRGTTKTIIY